MDDWLQQPPPWVAFPALPPAGVGARQGAEEAWIDAVWRPFWASLSPAQRERYLHHWQATDVWRDALRATFEMEAGFDAEADARESEAYLRERRQAGAAAPGTVAQRLARWFRRL